MPLPFKSTVVIVVVEVEVVVVEVVVVEVVVVEVVVVDVVDVTVVVVVEVVAVVDDVSISSSPERHRVIMSSSFSSLPPVLTSHPLHCDRGHRTYLSRSLTKLPL